MDYTELKGKKVLVTGATGLIGKKLVKYLLDIGTYVIAVIRDKNKAEKIFGYNKNLYFIETDITKFKPTNLSVEYIIHAASQTSSKLFIDKPVETIEIAINGTKNVLEFAKVNPVKSFVYLSTMEVYGAPIVDEKIAENHDTNIDTMKARSCYPESKRMCECLCASYFSEYNVPIVVLRLTQTFGGGVEYNDGRVFAEFARSVIENRDIHLKTKGETKRNYLCVDDAVSAILIALLKGKKGEAYNVANEQTYCSIYDMACLVKEKCANNKIDVIIDENEDVSKFGFAPVLHMNLDTSKFCKLGWEPKFSLKEMFNQMITEMKK